MPERRQCDAGAFCTAGSTMVARVLDNRRLPLLQCNAVRWFAGPGPALGGSLWHAWRPDGCRKRASVMPALAAPLAARWLPGLAGAPRPPAERVSMLRLPRPADRRLPPIKPVAAPWLPAPPGGCNLQRRVRWQRDGWRPGPTAGRGLRNAGTTPHRRGAMPVRAWPAARRSAGRWSPSRQVRRSAERYRPAARACRPAQKCWWVRTMWR
jgi:hypothetical protein